MQLGPEFESLQIWEGSPLLRRELLWGPTVVALGFLGVPRGQGGAWPPTEVPEWFSSLLCLQVHVSWHVCISGSARLHIGVPESLCRLPLDLLAGVCFHRCLSLQMPLHVHM